jgi:hypothetical protein
VQWKKIIVIPIFKKGDVKLLGNCRGITVLITLLKVTTKLNSQKVTHVLRLCDEQQSFRRGPLCTDAVCINRKITEKALGCNRPAYFCFKHLVKEFDKLELKSVLDMLQRNNVPNGLVILIRNICKNNFIRVRCDSKSCKDAYTKGS